MELLNHTGQIRKFLRIFKHRQEHHMLLLPLQKPDLTQKIVPNPVHMLSWKGIKCLSILSYPCVLSNCDIRILVLDTGNVP
jgi:hypothetical protein